MRGHDLFRRLAVLAFLACYLTILLGGNVAASNSGLACPDWPTCHGTFLPPVTGSTGIEWSHRLSAFVLSLLIALLSLAALLYERTRPVLRRLAFGALGAVVVQAVLGAVVVASELSAGIVILHLGLATLLFGLLLLLAILANVREVPLRWREWAWRAAEEDPTASVADPADRPFADEPVVPTSP